MATEINAYLDEMAYRMKTLLREQALKRSRPTRRDIEQALFGYSHATNTLTLAYAAFLTEKRKTLSEGSAATLASLLEMLREFERRWGTLHFANVNEAFRDGFVQMLATDNGNNNTSINKRLGQLRTFLKWAAAKDLCDARVIAAMKPLPDVDKTDIYLTADELRRIEALDLAGTNLVRAREVFLLQCYTGLRFSDAMLLGRQHIIEAEGLIDIMNQKTGRRVILPLLPAAEALLRRNGWKLPRIANATLNEEIKELGKLTGLTELIELTDMTLAKKTRRTVEKWQRLTSHSARDTFATLLVQGGVPLEHVRKLLGHTNAAQTREYDKTTAADIARALRGK